MKASDRAGHVARETILKMLSSEQVARVGTAEVADRLPEGEERPDLGLLDQGIQGAKASSKVAMGHVLPRAAIRPEISDRVLAQLAR